MSRRTALDWQEAAQRVREDGPIPVSKAAKLVPADNPHGHASACTLVRWIVRGKRGVYLDGARLAGKTWWTSAGALERFWAALAARETWAVDEQRERGTMREWQARADAAGRELDELIGT